jgi:predicted nucleic acid-binding protein
MTTLVFDASAATKWFKRAESSAEEALSLLVDPTTQVWLPDNCAHEVIRGVNRRVGARAAALAWASIRQADVTVAHADDALVFEAVHVAEEFGCDYYDALAPALARLLGGTLVSADRRAHAAFPGAIMLG